MPDFFDAVHCLIFLGLMCSLASVALNMASFERLGSRTLRARGDGRRGAKGGAATPRVSILVPARNEERNIEACVRSLLAQDYPEWELVVLDDQSEDRTTELALACGAGLESEGRLRLLKGRPLPAGWAGKNWACHQLAEEANGDFLFFTDADTVHAPGMVGALVEYAQRERADLVSAWPRLVEGSWAERLVLPMLPFAGMVWYPHLAMLVLERTGMAGWMPRGFLRMMGAANGQCLFFRRRSYEELGGHGSVREHLVEDLALGRAVAMRMGEGWRLRNCEAVGLCECRMYRSFREVWEGFSKNARPAFEGRVSVFLLAGVVQFGLYVLPFLALLGPADVRGWAWAEVGVVYLIRAVVGIRFGSSAVGVAAHPLGCLLAFAIALNSWRWSLSARLLWKGRTYAHTIREEGAES